MPRYDDSSNTKLLWLAALFLAATVLVFFAGYEIGLSLADENVIIAPESKHAPETKQDKRSNSTGDKSMGKGSDTLRCSLHSLLRNWKQRCVQLHKV